MDLTIETELEDDGRWLAEVPELPGVMAYGATRDEAMAKAHKAGALDASQELWSVIMFDAFLQQASKLP